MPDFTLNDFSEAIREALYNPRRDRITTDSPSAELNQGAGNTISGIKVKFYLEDDGGTWDDGNIIQPRIIWDMKKIVSTIIIDSGYNYYLDGENITSIDHINLIPNNVNETPDGILFRGTITSYLASTNSSISSEHLPTDEFLFNIWFKPESHSFTDNVLFDMFNGTNHDLMIKINGVTNETYRIGITIRNETERQITDILSIDIRQHLMIFVDGTSLSVYLNGIVIYSDTLLGVLNWNNTFQIEIGKKYQGEISYISMNFEDDGTFTTEIIKNYFKFGYPLPRGKELVDLTDPANNLNFFLDIGNIDKAIETVKGSLYMKTNTIKLKTN
jgi:hypothetical protein